MKPVLSMMSVAAMALTGCSNSDDVNRLRTEIARQDMALQAETARWESERDALKRDIANLRARLGEVATSDPSKPLTMTLSELEKRVVNAEKGEAMAARVSAMEAKVDSLDKRPADKPAGTVNEDRVREMIEEKLAANTTAGQPTKNFAQAIARLKISEAEKEAIRQSIIDCKKTQLELLETPTAEGRIFAEEVIDAFIKISDGKAGQGDLTKLFVEIAGTKVPGDTQARTYLQVIEEAKKKNRDVIGKLLTPEDQGKLTQAHADWSDFELGEGDPWGALFMQRMEKYQKAKGE